MKKIPWKWVVLALVVLLVAGGALRAISARKAQQEALAASTAQKAQTVVELAATDVVRAEMRELTCKPAGLVAEVLLDLAQEILAGGPVCWQRGQRRLRQQRGRKRTVFGQ